MFSRFLPNALSRPLGAAALALGLATGAALLPAPVAAEGQFTIRIDPRTQDEADGIRLALALYGLREDIRSGAGVTQRGVNNLARLGQSGSRNLGVIHQRGDDHRGRLNQRGTDNAFGLFQSGTGTSARVRQTGTGQTGLLFVHGW